MNMLIYVFFELTEGSKTGGHEVPLIKEQYILDMSKYSFSMKIITNKGENEQ